MNAVLNSDVEALRVAISHQKLAIYLLREKIQTFSLPHRATTMMQTGKIQHSDGGYHWRKEPTAEILYLFSQDQITAALRGQGT